MRALTTSAFLLLIALIIVKISFADMPGNVIRKDVTVQFLNVQSLGNFQLHIADYDRDLIIDKDTAYTIYASRGAPHNIMIFAIQGNTTSDTLFFSEYGQKDYTVTFRGVNGNQLIFRETSVSVTGSGDTENARTSAVAVDKNILKRNEVLIGVSLAAIAGLIVLFLWRRRKKDISNIDTVA